MKVLICNKKDFAGSLALNRLVKALAPRHSVHVILSDYVLEAERENVLSSCLVSHERDKMLDRVLPWLDATFPPASINGSGAYLSFEGLAAKYGIVVEELGPIRTEQAAEHVRALAPDVIISCRYDYVFRDNVLAIPPLGIYGLHPGALPALRGLCGPFRAMEQGHARSGCTLFHLDAGLDSGPVVEIGWADIKSGRSLLWNFVQTYFAGVDTLLRHLPELERGERLDAHPQDTARQAYYTYPTEEELRGFIDGGNALVTRKDYLELLSLYLPKGQADPRMKELEELVNPVGCC